MNHHPHGTPTRLRGLRAPLSEQLPEFTDGVRIVPAGATVYCDGDLAGAVYALLTGRVRLTSRSGTGIVVMTGQLQPGALFGLDSFTQDAHGETATAETPSSVRAVPVSMLDRLLVRRPELAAGMMEALVRRRCAAERLLTRALMTGVPGRLAGALLDAAEGRVVDGLTRQELAEAAWTTRETATRVLYQLEASGLLCVHGRRIELVDVERLGRLAAGERRQPAA